MCLYTKEAEAKTASRNIVCYKILEARKNCYNEDIRITPFQGMFIDNEIVNGESPLLPFGIRDAVWEWDENKDRYIISKGFIHTYKRKRYAKKCAKFLRGGLYRKKYKKAHCNDTVFDIVVYKCIIPKESKYYDGVDSHEWDSYASDSIKFVKELCV